MNKDKLKAWGTVGLIIAGCSAAGNIERSGAAPGKAIALREARFAPTYLYLLPAGKSVTPTQCPNDNYYTDIQAYKWNGQPLGRQHWNKDHDRIYWRRVSFDGLTFRNHEKRAVLVAGWCM